MKKLLVSAMMLLPAARACAQGLGTNALSAAETVSATMVTNSSVFALPGVWVVGLVVVALLAAFVAVGMMRAELKTAQKESGAGGYIREGSFHLSVDRDHFLYRTETRRKIEQEKKEGK